MGKVQSYRFMRKKIAIPERQQLYQKRKKKLRSAYVDPNAFLKQSFGSVTALGRSEDSISTSFSKSFFASLGHLAAAYQFPAEHFSHLPYPQNMLVAFQNAQRRVYQADNEAHLVLFTRDNKSATLSTVKVFDTGLTLYYLPLETLWSLHVNKHKAAFQVLLSIYAYLYQKAGMALFQRHNYVGDTYLMIKEDLNPENGTLSEKEYSEYERLFTLIDRVTPILNSAIGNKINLTAFEERLMAFKPATLFERELYQTAIQCFELYEQYPDRQFDDYMCGQFLYPDEEDRTYADQYFSFCWSANDHLMANIEHYANCDLQERGFLDEPCSIQLFDRKCKVPKHNFDYHTRLLDMLNNIADILKEYA